MVESFKKAQWKFFDSFALYQEYKIIQKNEHIFMPTTTYQKRFISYSQKEQL